MKYLASGAILFTGLLSGFFIGKYSAGGETVITELSDPEYITEVVRDTVIQTEQIAVASENSENDTLNALNDSLIWINDTLHKSLNGSDTLLNGEDLHIRRERMIAYKSLALIHLTEPVSADSVIKEALGIDHSRQTSVSVEFWESPLNYSGYKFSKKKLILYGMSPQLAYKVYRKGTEYFLNVHDVYYKLRETTDFVNYQQVGKEVVFND